MTTEAATLPRDDFSSLAPTARGWKRWAALAFSTALLIAIVVELHDGGFDVLTRALPSMPAFYLAFAAGYIVLPLFDWIIFRRLWGLPFAGLIPLLKKRVSNDVMFGYSGEAYFYLWVRERPALTARPFAAIKDVSILSALAGNVMTLVLLLLAWPMLQGVTLAVEPQLLLGSGAIIIGISFAILLFGKRIFSLSRRDLGATFSLHMLRSMISTLFLAIAWYFALPQVGVEYWVLFAALRMVINRLPLIPSKDLLFAAAAVFLTDKGDAMGAVVAMSAGLFLATNLALGILLTGTDFIGQRRA
ncbi:hypothetical protein ACSMXM_02380 [Pacificimonas sp. ICDLI1SI03]